MVVLGETSTFPQQLKAMGRIHVTVAATNRKTMGDYLLHSSSCVVLGGEILHRCRSMENYPNQILILLQQDKECLST